MKSLVFLIFFVGWQEGLFGQVIGLDSSLKVGDSLQLSSNNIIPSCSEGRISFQRKDFVESFVDSPLEARLSNRVFLENKMNSKFFDIITDSFGFWSRLPNKKSFIFGMRRGVAEEKLSRSNSSRCGDIIFNSAVLGMEFYAKFELEFSNFNTAMIFERFFPNQTSLYRLVRDIRSVQDFLPTDFRIRLSLMQNAGSRNRYNQLLAEMDSRLLIGISSDDLSILEQGTNLVEDYILGDKGIRSQLLSSNGSILKENIGIIQTSLVPKNSSDMAELETWKKDLLKYQSMISPLRRRSQSFKDIMNRSGFSSFPDTVTSLKAQVDNTLSHLSELYQSCLMSLTDCPDPTRQEVEYRKIMQETEWSATFLDYCLSDFLTGEQFKVKLALLDIANTEDCWDATDFFDNNLTIDLSNRSIRDISILRGLRRVEELDLSFNQITDPEPLLTLSSLRSLNLRNNDIVSIHLKNLTSLLRLSLMNNKIRNLSNISIPNGLTQVNIIDNEVSKSPDFDTSFVSTAFRQSQDICLAYLEYLLTQGKITFSEFNTGMLQMKIPKFRNQLVDEWERCNVGYQRLSEFSSDFLL